MVQCHINNAIAISPRRRMCPHKKSSHTCTLSLPHMDAGRLIQSIPLISSPSEKPEKAQFVDTSNQRLLHHCQCQMEYIYIFLYIFLSSSLSLSSSCLHHCHCHFLVFIIVIVIFLSSSLSFPEKYVSHPQMSLQELSSTNKNQ